MSGSADVNAAGRSTPAAGPDSHLRRVLGLWEVTAGGVGIIIGAGIYVLLGAATAEAGSAVWLAFVFAAVLSAFTGLSYAELTSMFPRASAEFEYTRHALPGWMSFLVGWLMISGFVVAAATVALGFARYLAYFVPFAPRAGALLVIALVTAIALTGIKYSARVTLALAAVQIGGLLLVIAIGAPHLGQVNLVEGASAGGILGAAALVFFAFIGFDDVNTLAEETRDPTRTLPRAILLALGISTTLYILVALAAVSVLGATALGSSERPLADVIGHVLGSRSQGLVAAIALIATTNTVLLTLTASSRLLYGMASQGAFPTALAVVEPRRGTPRRTILIVASGAAAFTLIGDLKLIASVTDFAIYLVFLATNATVVILRLRRPELPRPFRVPGAIGVVPVLPVLGFASVALMLTQLEPRAILLGLPLVLAGAALSVLLRSINNPDGEQASGDADHPRMSEQ